MYSAENPRNTTVRNLGKHQESRVGLVQLSRRQMRQLRPVAPARRKRLSSFTSMNMKMMERKKILSRLLRLSLTHPVTSNLILQNKTREYKLQHAKLCVSCPGMGGVENCSASQFWFLCTSLKVCQTIFNLPCFPDITSWSLLVVLELPSVAQCLWMQLVSHLKESISQRKQMMMHIFNAYNLQNAAQKIWKKF